MNSAFEHLNAIGIIEFDGERIQIDSKFREKVDPLHRRLESADFDFFLENVCALEDEVNTKLGRRMLVE